MVTAYKHGVSLRDNERDNEMDSGASSTTLDIVIT